jgi:hypothetical protein
MEDYIKTNSYQTPLTEELRKSLHKEVWQDLMEFIDSVGFIKNLIQPESIRGKAKDRPKHPDSRIVVDITKPHLLEDMDFFRERAIFFEKHGHYTHLRPNPNPKSEYAQFWAEEMHRWKHGYTRPSDGEWIPGEYYFYLNYSPIWINTEVSKNTGSKKSKGERKKKFPRVWLGDYLFFHYLWQARESGGHAKLLKARGVGFSYKLASLSPRNMYVEPGLPNFHLASDKTFLDGEKGVFGKVVDVLDWIASTTPLPRMRLVNSIRSREIQLGYEEDSIRKGLMSSVYGISLKDNPDKARGVRGPLIHYEEDGLFPNLEKAWNVNRKAVEDGDIVYGLMLAGGTGGTEGADFEGSEKLFRTPLAYNIYGIPNVFDKNSNGETKCGFFWGAYLNRAKCYDEENGEPDVVKAMVEILEDRYLVKYNSSDPQVITQKMAEEPIVPSEATMRTSGTIFPVADLKDYRDSIRIQGQRYFDSHYTGELVLTSKGVEWKPSSDSYPIRRFPIGTDRPEGGVEIFEMPKTDHKGKIDPVRYISGIDPIDDDYSGTNSLASIFIFDLYTDRIVAEYTGRPKFANDFYEICRRLLMFYNAKANYENDKKGLFAYFDQKRCLHLLCDTPQILRDMEYVKGGSYGNKAKGSNSGKMINAWGRRLQKDWMQSKAFTQDYDEDGNQVGEKSNMHTIRGIAYLEELIAWNIDINADRVSAMGMLMIYREDRLKYLANASGTEEGEEEDKYIEENFKNAFTPQNSYEHNVWMNSDVL